ncbi:hypothetical protein [Alkalihalobacterium alkalinitrilicum]|uniref:hypothetical protein n=1 Tax=Alkalihalobacterium alkalinitrilicum TaxID=427920 RepID=UPI000994F646|nr:hypothetical protein [Alkalihalobacterium alkalinitrilicum]
MNVVASFDHTVYLELAIKELEKHGIAKDDIFAIPLNEKIQPRKNIDIIHGGGLSLLDGTFAWGTVFAVIGVVYGFVLTGGPVMWGLIGLAFGLIFGFLFDFLLHRKKRQDRKKRGEGGEVMMVIHCQKEQVSKVKEILFEHFTLGLHVIDEENKSLVH